ncbi:MAG TPA: hypothetical protein DEB73_03520 [Candidatus Magasanikbacteria bacterium]|nr:hypothetical protein [Candidatus Magasanikbacteria bacterium]HBX16208.1 hypothetical protein [Candidatus Magasanikbacteria bacterium]
MKVTGSIPVPPILNMDTGRKDDGKFRELMDRLRKESEGKKTAQKSAERVEPNSLVGYDLGLGVLDILGGNVAEESVRTIFVNESESNFDKLIADCKKSIWKQNSEKGAEIARRLIAAGKVKESVDGSGEGGVKVGWMNVAGATKLKREDFADERNLD